MVKKFLDEDHVFTHRYVSGEDKGSEFGVLVSLVRVVEFAIDSRGIRVDLPQTASLCQIYYRREGVA